tara:strand:+ start:716 stop:1459 length:744 start_codon:yes stop_codon:yes gene_type:complete
MSVKAMAVDTFEAHAFSVDVATKCGVNAAIVFNHIHFWVKANQSKKKNFHDGKFWMYQSITEISEQFPYFTSKQITAALTKLVGAGLICKGNYNKAKYDRTTWYALNTAETAISPHGQMDFTSRANGIALQVSPIPDNNKDNKTYKNNIVRFNEFWKQYPKKVGKGLARKKYFLAVKTVSHEDIMKGLARYNPDPHFICLPATWLNQERWDDELTPSQRFENRAERGDSGEITGAVARFKNRRANQQ